MKVNMLQTSSTRGVYLLKPISIATKVVLGDLGHSEPSIYEYLRLGYSNLCQARSGALPRGSGRVPLVDFPVGRVKYNCPAEFRCKSHPRVFVFQRIRSGTWPLQSSSLVTSGLQHRRSGPNAIREI